MSKYLKFNEVGNSPSGKTKIFEVCKTDGFPLGRIQWHGAWRKYVFEPEAETIFDEECLADVCQELLNRTQQHREKRK